MIWDGNNTEDIVSYCADWNPDLCTYHHEFVNLLTGVRTLSIEPADTMRGYDLQIPIGAKCIRVKEGYRHFIVVEI